MEAFVIRFLWVLHYLRPKKQVWLCPPKCCEGHTFKWPCRARVRDSAYSRYMARPKLHARNLAELSMDFDFSSGPQCHLYMDRSGNVTQIVPKDKLSNLQMAQYAGLLDRD